MRETCDIDDPGEGDRAKLSQSRTDLGASDIDLAEAGGASIICVLTETVAYQYMVE